MKILFLTGTRADFGKLKPLITESKKIHDVSIFATGMHMMDKYGMTCYEISKSGFEYYPFINQDSNTPMDRVLRNTIDGLSYYVQEHPTDLLVVHGDRVEALAGACVGALNNILVAHIEGGEVSGTIDESIRHAVSKLSHIHFVSNEQAANRLRHMGETNIFVIGSPDIDIMLGELPSLEEVKEKYDIKFSEYAICIYHPVTTDAIDLSLFEVIQESDKNFVIIYPNNDPGSKKIITRIDTLEGSNYKVLPSMRFEHFLTLLKNSEFIIGNSSVGIRESIVYGIPTINIGTRQAGRHRCESIVDVPEDATEILRSINNLPPRIKSYAFGRGNSAKLFCEQLRRPELWAIKTQKEFIDV
jgi:UDP-N-acetylglucosamine 2-epimerase (hydrolysing)